MCTTVDDERIINAIRGAFVADAACMGTHWIYNPEEMKLSVPSVEAPEFKDPPTPNYYSSEEYPGHYGKGMLSPYGEQLLFCTEFAAKNGMIRGSEMSNAMKVWAETFGGRPDHATLQFLELKKNKGGPNCGVDDDQAHCFTKVVPVTCLYAGKPERRAKVEEAIRVHQENDAAVAFGLALSNILEALLLGMTLDVALGTALIGIHHNAVPAAIEYGRSMAEMSKTLEQTAAAQGRSCHLPESFIVPIHALYDSLSSPSGARYEEAIRANILASGDTCSRGIAIGAIMGAAFGGPPKSWIDRMDASQLSKVDAAAAAIASFCLNQKAVGGPCDPNPDLTRAALRMRSFVELKDRKYRLKTYRRCFVGSEAVDFLVKDGLATSREDAVELGKRIQSDMKLFVHVTGDHEFKDAYLFYEFVE